MGRNIVHARRFGNADVAFGAISGLLLCLACYLDHFTDWVGSIPYYHIASGSRSRFSASARDPRFSASIGLDGAGLRVCRNWSIMVCINLAVRPAGCSARSVII